MAGLIAGLIAGHRTKLATGPIGGGALCAKGVRSAASGAIGARAVLDARGALIGVRAAASTRQRASGPRTPLRRWPNRSGRATGSSMAVQDLTTTGPTGASAAGTSSGVGLSRARYASTKRVPSTGSRKRQSFLRVPSMIVA